MVKKSQPSWSRASHLALKSEFESFWSLLFLFDFFKIYFLILKLKSFKLWDGNKDVRTDHNSWGRSTAISPMTGISEKRVKVIVRTNREKSGNTASRKRPRISFAQTKEAKGQICTKISREYAGDIAVDMSQGLRICWASFVWYIARN